MAVLVIAALSSRFPSQTCRSCRELNISQRSFRQGWESFYIHLQEPLNCVPLQARWDRPDGYESPNSNPYQEPTRQNSSSSRPRSPSPDPDQQPIRHRKPSQKESQPRYRVPSQEETQPRYQVPGQEGEARHRAPLVGTARRPPSFADRLKSAEAGVSCGVQQLCVT